MKTSQYILLTYIGFIILLTLILYIDSAQKFTDNRAETTSQTSKNEALSTSMVIPQDSVISVGMYPTNKLHN